MRTKLLIAAFGVYLLPSVVLAQSEFRRNDEAETITTQANTAPAPAGVSKYGEVWVSPKVGKKGCSSAMTAVNTPQAIVGATPNVAHVVSQITCSNTSATPVAVTIRDSISVSGNTIHSDLVKGVDRAVMPFPNPYKLPINSALSVSGSVAGSVTCCSNYKDYAQTPTATPTNTPTATATRTATPTP